MIITKKHLSRRTVLRGLGTTLALPLLDSMVPALTAVGKTAAKPVKRLSILYTPNGMTMQAWTPATEGAFELTPILAPLASYRDRLLVLSGLNDEAGKPIKGEGIGEHARGCPSWLSGVHPRKTPGADVFAGVSMDQIAAKHFGNDTQFTSLEMGLDFSEDAGICDGGYSCAYANAISWRSPTTPNPPEINPRAMFERMFGAGGSDPALRLKYLKEDRSILDSLGDNVNGLQQKLGTRDRVKLGEYLEAVRDAERRIQKAEEQNDRDVVAFDRPSGIPASFEEHIKIMFDLQVLAYQTDLTRVITFMVGREISTRAYPQIGVPEAHHGLSHHGNDPEKLAKLAKLNNYHVQMFTYYLDKLRSVQEGEGTLLDRTLIMYGACLSDSNKHDHENLPVFLIGGTKDQFTGGRHVRYAKGTPQTNLFLNVLDCVDVPAEKLGDSTGRLSGLKA
jgi:hypothetical protein